MAEVLKNTKATALVSASHKIISVKSSDNVPKVFETLVKNKILSAPVQDDDGKWVGVVDMMDVLAVVVNCFEQEELESKGIDGILDQHLRFVEQKSKDISNISNCDAFVAIREDASVYDAIKAMVDKRVHRVAVMNDKDEILSLVTQSSVLQFINKNLDKFAVAKKKCDDIDGWKGEVLNITEDTRAIDAFVYLSTMHMSGVAIVDDDGKFIGALSSSDIKIIGPYAEYFQKLYTNVMSYITEIRMKNLKAVYPAISGHGTDTFGKVIQKLAATRIHRLFMVDEKQKLVGCMTLSDVLKAVLNTV